jgi:hypothetical protein
MKIGITERGDGGMNFPVVLDALATGRVHGAIVITKDPRLLLETAWPDPLIAHCTITGCGGTAMEPKAPPPEETLAAYHALVERYGGERVVLRVDPIIPHPDWIGRAQAIVPEARGRIRVSCLDAYTHVRNRLRTIGVELTRWPGVHAPLNVRQHYLAELQALTQHAFEICGEPGMPCTGCVSARDLAAMGLPGVGHPGGFQRSACACIAEKTELLTVKAPCPYVCTYCYWKDR